MPERDIPRASTAEGLPVSPSLEPVLESAQVPLERSLVGKRVIYVSVISIVIAVLAAFVAQALIHLIGLLTNIAFYGRFSASFDSPAGNHLGPLVIFVPIIGGLIVGVMARFGSAAIRGHGIPEAMEQVLTNKSRIAARLVLLKPVSAAVSIGTGGPFGAEGPIIATGGALGSVVGQMISTTAMERKTLLTAGAAAGMAATFGSPVSAVLLAIELLLFEFRPRSVIPVALASATAAGIRMAFEGTHPIFGMPNLVQPSGAALAGYILVGAVVGVAAVGVTRAVYFIEDAFDRLPVHWMWWPAIGAVAVGVIGYFSPRTLGVGYENITDIISARLTLSAIAFLAVMKLISWSIALGSGTSGGTLAPLFTIGGGLGAVLGAALQRLMPEAGVDVRIAALVGMAALFAGASRAVLTSVVFAFETTLQPLGLLPLLGGCAAAYLISCLLMQQTIMTEKISRRGVRVPSEYTSDPLELITVEQMASPEVVSIRGSDALEQVRAWVQSGAPGSGHQGFPVLDSSGRLLGVVTRRDLLSAGTGIPFVKDLLSRPPIVVYADNTLREAADHMVNHDVGRLPVVSREDPSRLVGMITRSDVLAAHRRRLEEHRPEPGVRLRLPRLRRKQRGSEEPAPRRHAIHSERQNPFTHE